MGLNCFMKIEWTLCHVVPASQQDQGLTLCHLMEEVTASLGCAPANDGPTHGSLRWTTLT